ncbi:MAG: hypothetical protein ACI86L_000106, partial [Dokdonia sp.]
LESYIFKTTNYGKTWKKIVNGLDDTNGFARVVRADKKKKGLLYAGTEVGLYVSFNDGANWQRFKLNLPIVPINDLVIQDNDLVAATSGRGFWILDDLGTLQQSISTKGFHVFMPKDSYRIFGGTSKAIGQGQNPKSGITMDYFIPKKIDSLELKLEILQGSKIIRTFTSKKPKGFKSWPGGPSKPQVLPAKKGYNRFTWDLGSEALPAIDKVFVFGGLNGYAMGPGTYTLRMTLNDAVSETQATVLPNPSIDATAKDYKEQQALLATIAATLKDMHTSVNTMRSAKSQLKGYAALLKDNDKATELVKEGKALSKRITSWEDNLIQSKQKTFQDVINFNNKLNAQLINLSGYINSADPKVTQGAKERLQDLLNDWTVYKKERDAIISTKMKAYNDQFKALDIPALILKD